MGKKPLPYTLYSLTRLLVAHNLTRLLASSTKELAIEKELETSKRRHSIRGKVEARGTREK